MSQYDDTWFTQQQVSTWGKDTAATVATRLLLYSGTSANMTVSITIGAPTLLIQVEARK